MEEMYKAMPGSPITYLVGDISAGQTTIAIGDDTALPDAPNLATIGYGEHIETVRYGAKSNGVLQDVTRGIEGTPRAWQSGTEVARFFTAYDHNAIINTLTSHLAESAKKHIYDSGSNADGYWVQFDDGTMECYGEISENAYKNQLNFVSYGGHYRSEYVSFNFPKGFLLNTVPAVSLSTQNPLNYGIMIFSGNVGSQTFRIRALALNSSSVGNGAGPIQYKATGRWK